MINHQIIYDKLSCLCQHLIHSLLALSLLNQNETNMLKILEAVLSLPKLVELIFIAYAPEDLTSLIQVSTSFYKAIEAALLSQRQTLGKKLIMYNNFLELMPIDKKYRQKEHIIKYSNFGYYRQKIRLKFSQQGNLQKINFVFALRCKEKLVPNQTYEISYSYQLKGKRHKTKIKSQNNQNKNSKKYFWKFQFQYIQSQNTPKQFWLYQNPKKQQTNLQQCEIFLMQQQSKDYTYIMDCKQICKQDIIKIEFPYLVNGKKINLQEFIFYPLKMQKCEQSFVSTIQNFFNKKKVSKCQCEVQNKYDWRKYEYIKSALMFELEDIISCYKELELKEIYINSLEDHYKIQLICRQKLQKSKFLNHFISISDKEENVQVFLKQKGAVSHEKQQINLRVGDMIIVYINMT